MHPVSVPLLVHQGLVAAFELISYFIDLRCKSLLCSHPIEYLAQLFFHSQRSSFSRLHRQLLEVLIESYDSLDKPAMSRVVFQGAPSGIVL